MEKEFTVDEVINLCKDRHISVWSDTIAIDTTSATRNSDADADGRVFFPNAGATIFVENIQSIKVDRCNIIIYL